MLDLRFDALPSKLTQKMNTFHQNGRISVVLRLSGHTVGEGALSHDPPTPHTKPVVGLLSLHMEVRWGGAVLHIVPWGQIKAYGSPLLGHSTTPNPQNHLLFSSSSVFSAQMIVKDLCWDQSRCHFQKLFWHFPHDRLCYFR